jgi:LPXTG-site transpeptidase (sortase) family protein
MVRTWPSLVHRAHESAKVLGAMMRTCAASIRRAHASVQPLGAVVTTWPPLVRPAVVSSAQAINEIAKDTLSLLARAGLSAQVFGEMVRKAPAVPRAHISAKVLGEIALAALLLVTLAFSWRDGVPSNGFDDSLAATQPAAHMEAIPGEQPSFGLTLQSLGKLSGWANATGVAVSSKALIPTSPPAQLLIPSLNVHRPVEAVGANRYGVMNLPVNGWNAGWYKGSPVPGAPGDAVIEGHAGYPDQPMIFGKLAKLRSGDQIVVVLSDGSKRLFVVVSTAVVPVGTAPPGLAEPYGPARLTLVTCTGSFDEKSFSYSKRMLVEAKYAGTV